MSTRTNISTISSRLGAFLESNTSRRRNSRRRGLDEMSSPLTAPESSQQQQQYDHEDTSSVLSSDDTAANVSISHLSTMGTAEMLHRLYVLCDQCTEDDPVIWDAVRAWLASHSPEEARMGAEQMGEFSSCAMHLACRNCPPEDIVEALLNVAKDTVEWTDIFGWLPLHYACANGASDRVIQMLIEAYPPSVKIQDKKGRTPLHFALNLLRPATPAAIGLLASTGAAYLADENGMVPLHYACAYGASEAVLDCLINANPDSLFAKDKKGRIPLHSVMGNADRPASPAIVRKLLSLSTETVNVIDKDGGLPLHLLAARSSSFSQERAAERENISKCLQIYLSARPIATADFLTALQSLPSWARDVAVVTPTVQDDLNQLISKRFPTAILMLDFYFLLGIIIAFTLGTYQSIDSRVADPDHPTYVDVWIITVLYIGATYFILRELVQMTSLWSLGLFKDWFLDSNNWIDVTTIVLVLVFTTFMKTGGASLMTFRTGTALTIGVLWASTLSYVKSVNIQFAVFVSGVFYVLRCLVTFMIASIVVLICFAQSFVTVFTGTERCSNEIDELNSFFCKLPTSFLYVYTFMLGEVDDTEFIGNVSAILFFALFVFLVVIILTTVLIAIVTDSYRVIKQERASVVFWNNRLDFIAEINAIMSGPWKKRLLSLFWPFDLEDEQAFDDITINETFGNDLWDRITDVFEDEDLHVNTCDFWAYLVLRIAAVLFIGLIWLPIGFITAGWLWPPQVREYLFVKSMTKQSTLSLTNDTRNMEVKALQKELEDLQETIEKKTVTDRREIMALKEQFKSMQEDMANEMKDIKQIVTVLFDYSMDGSGP